MKFFKVKKAYITPTASALLQSISNNTRMMPYLAFMWSGFFVYYILFQNIEWLLVAVLLSVFWENYNLSQKIDKARLEILSLKDIVKLKGDKNA